MAAVLVEVSRSETVEHADWYLADRVQGEFRGKSNLTIDSDQYALEDGDAPPSHIQRGSHPQRTLDLIRKEFQFEIFLAMKFTARMLYFY